MENPPAQKTIYSAITDISTETLVKDPFEQYVEKKAISLPGNPNSKLVLVGGNGLVSGATMPEMSFRIWEQFFSRYC